jgi:hypothetical protein
VDSYRFLKAQADEIEAKQRAKLEAELTAPIRADVSRLTAANAQMREALEAIIEDNDVGGIIGYDAINKGRAALSPEPIDWHNPADVKRIAELEEALAEAQQEAARYAEYERQAVLQR